MDVKVKKRAWVKNAVIIFLSIMLVLTFFSNTIMNRSLAEVATQYVNSGSISAKIRGTGTVSANSPYEVSIKEGRIIQSVMVQVGDTVEIGDVLIKLTEDADTQLKEAQDALDQLKYDYQMLLLEMASADYTRENREISKMKEDIAEAEAERDKLYVSDAEISAAKIAVNSAQTKYDKAKEAADEAHAALDAFKENFTSSGSDFSALQQAHNEAEEKLNVVKIQYESDSQIFRKAAANMQAESTYPYDLSTFEAALYEIITGQKIQTPSGDNAESEGETNAVLGETTSTEDNSDLKKWFEGTGYEESLGYMHYATAYYEIKTATDAEKSTKRALEAAGYDVAIETAMKTLEANIKEANNLTAAAEKELTDAKASQEELEKKKADYKTADDAIDEKRDGLEEAIFNLSQTQKQDNIDAQKDQLNLAQKKKDLEEQQALVDKLSSGEAIYEITANAAGVVSSINAVAGKTTVPDETLMVIDQTDRGFTLSFSVTTQQAQKVKVGDKAEVSTSSWWFDGVIDATLTGISANPTDPKNSKILNFTITGDVSGGDQLTLSIGERSQNYDLIVPKSALRTDSNGTYVLLMEQKASALGNRYYATRVDVEVIASDDTQSAVSGGLSSGDFVITSSSKPVEAGDQVRLTEN
jgi:multidrug efflux pump subunit AcrA (membrane-fusion protein)